MTYGIEFVQPEARAETLFKKARNFLYLHSRLYSATIDLLRSAGMQSMPGLASLLVSAGFVDVVRPVVNAGNIYLFINPPEEAWTMTEAIIRQLNEEVEAHGGQLLVAILPDETEVDQQKWGRFLRHILNCSRKRQRLIFNPATESLKFCNSKESYSDSSCEFQLVPRRGISSHQFLFCNYSAAPSGPEPKAPYGQSAEV